MPNKRLITIIAISISLSCLFFVRAFRYLLYPYFNGYYEFDIPNIEFAALYVGVWILAMVFVVVLLALEYTDNATMKTVLHIAFILLALACFTGLNNEILNWLIEGRQESVNYELPLLVFALALVFAIRPKLSLEKVAGNIQTIALLFLIFTFTLITQSSLTWMGLSGLDLSPQAIENPSVQRALSNRVVWLIFDEFDAAVTETKPSQFTMPSLDRLLGESFIAEKAYPTNFWTKQALPSLLAGQLVDTTEPTSSRDMVLTFQNGGEPRSLADAPNVFQQVKCLGGSTGVVGWVHPYPRLFQNSLDYGYWQGAQVVRCDGIVDCLPELASDAFESLPFPNPFAFRSRFNERGRINDNRFMEGQIKRAPAIRDKAIQLASDKRLDFVFVHFSIPHARFLTRDLHLSEKGYLEALEAVDETIALIRKEMESAGVWESTSLIISGDHWWRFKSNEYLDYLPESKRAEVMADRRVPFVIKLANHSEASRYSGQFNTVVTQSIVLGLLSGELKNGNDIAAKIDELRSRNPLEINHIPNLERIAPDVFERNAGSFRIGGSRSDH